MNPENFPEAKYYNIHYHPQRDAYLKRHPEFWQFNFPENFYYKIYDDRLKIHWAVIIHDKNKTYSRLQYVVYFIDVAGRAFDKLEFLSKKQAKIALRRNKFYFSTNKKCPYLPVNPIYVNLSCGKKSAPYSKGNLWNRGIRFNVKKNIKNS